MALYIAVLNTDLGNNKWLAVQWDANLQSLINNSNYRANENKLYNKKTGDTTVQQKRITEVVSQLTADATIIKLSDSENNNLFKRVGIFFKNLFVLLLGSGLLFSCCKTGKLTKRYSSVNQYAYSTGNDSIKHKVAVDPYFFDPEESKPSAAKSVFDLSPQGQKALIKALDGKETKSDEFLSKLSKSIADSQKEPVALVDKSKFSKRLVIATNNLMSSPADRITKLKVNFNLPAQNYISITSFDKLITKYETIDIGKQTFNSTTNLGLTGNLGTSAKTTATAGNTIDAASNNGTGLNNLLVTEVNAANGVTGNISNARVFGEEVMLRQRYVAATGYVTPNTLTIFQESISGVDLTGNIIADITLLYKDNTATKTVYQFSNLVKEAKPVTPLEIEVAEQVILYPNFTADLKLDYEFEATVRQVNNGDKTISEADDKISLISGEYKNAGAILLLRKDELKPKLWMIDYNSTALMIKDQTTAGGVLFFNSFDKARSFLLWLKKSYSLVKGNNIGEGYSLFVSAGSLDKTYINNAKVIAF